MSRLYAYSVSLLLIGAVLAPAFGDPPRDDFPLSTYPMFSRPLRDAKAELPSALAVMSDGSRRRVPPELINSADVLQALVSLRQALRQGKEAAEQQCRAIAGQLATNDEVWRDARAVELVMQRLDAVAYFAERAQRKDAVDDADDARTVHARCEVPR